MLQEYITDFISYCKVAGFSAKSIESLTASLRDFARFANCKSVERADDITYGMLIDFVADFHHPSVHKKKARVWCLHQFFHFLTVSKAIPKNIALGLAYPKIEKTVPFFLTEKEYNRIIRYFVNQANCKIGLRNLVIVLILGMLGLRNSTLIALDIEHIDIEAGIALVHEKGNKKRLMVLPDALVQILELYLNRLEQDSGPLFLSIREKRISPRTLQDIFQGVRNELGLDQSLNARLFRHTAATLLNKVAGTSVTQTVLGHERRGNTLRYTHLNPDQYALYMRRHPFMQEGQS
jgi:site-specific recombinase XerD